MEVVVKEHLGRCAVAGKDLPQGETFLTEKAALYWTAGPHELLDIIRAYRSASHEEKARIDDLTSEVQTPSPELDALVHSWKTALEEAVSQGDLPAENFTTAFLPILLKAHFNAHAVQTPEGACLFPKGAMLNHSCAPNAFYRCEAHTIHFVANTAVTKGEELTAAYLDAVTMLKPTKYRQSMLLVAKGFLCACERCASQAPDSTRPLRCKTSACQGLLLPSNSGTGSAPSPCSWHCTTCDATLAGDEARAIELVEDELYRKWQSLDEKFTQDSPISTSELSDAIKEVSAKLHPSHFITQLHRILAIEKGATAPSADRLQLISHAYTYADWLYNTFQSVPANLLGTMTGALAELFDRKTSSIVQGVNVDRVLTIMKTVLPYAQSRYGKGAAYPKALESVLERYTVCASLICDHKGKLMRCGRCASVGYCSRSCQVFHYKSQGHKVACLAIVEAQKKLQALQI